MSSNNHASTPRVDFYTKAVLTAIALLLAVLAVRPAVTPLPAHAQSDKPNLYIEPGVTSIRKPDGSGLGDGKMVIDLNTGDIWGFPTMLGGAPYPVDISVSTGGVSKPVYLGHFEFSAMKRN